MKELSIVIVLIIIIFAICIYSLVVDDTIRLWFEKPLKDSTLGDILTLGILIVGVRYFTEDRKNK